ncbi:MAG: thymidine kinase [Pseudomonadota bacterium]
MSQLYFYYSSMNAGKSTALLQSAHNYREQGMQVRLFTAALDDRFGVGKIRSRIGIEADADVFDADSDLFVLIDALRAPHGLACVLVDEAQFLSRQQVDQLTAVVDQLGIPVLCYGIRTDFRGELFSGSQRLLAVADKLYELKTVCHCGRKATMVVRKDDAGQPLFTGGQVEIGGNDRYEPVCRRHFREALQQWLRLHGSAAGIAVAPATALSVDP